MKLTVLALFILAFVNCQCTLFDENLIQEYVEIINKANQEAEEYVPETDASEYEPYDDTPIDFGTFDFIVIGAGPGGSPITNRLSENENWKVLLLEAGSFGNNVTEMPALDTQALLSHYNWPFSSVPQENACLAMTNQSCPYPRGRGVGGSNLVNLMVYARGSSMDYDRIAEITQDDDWSYEKVLPYFIKSENFVHNDKSAPVDPRAHGKGGYLNIEYHLPHSPQIDAFFEANLELGYPIADYNSNKGLGASPLQLTARHGRRHDAGTAFIKPITYRENLQVQTESYVTKITIDPTTKTVLAVNFTHNNINYYANVRKEVILSAGVFGSARILMSSGVGPRFHLESLGIDVIEDLEVGSSVLDHIGFFGLFFLTNYTEEVKPLEEFVRQYLEGYGPLTSGENSHGVGFYESSFTEGTGYPDIELFLLPANPVISNVTQSALPLDDETLAVLAKDNDPTKTLNLYVEALHTVSEGTIRLKSSNPFDYPLIDPKYFTDPEGRDIQIVYEGIQLMLNLTQTKAFQRLNATLIGGPLPGCLDYEYLSKDYWYCAIKQFGYGAHSVASCPMGVDPKNGAVVDSKLRVYGIKNLRVSDASVIPINMAGHPVAPVIMLSEKVADYIKEEYRYF